MREQKFRVWDKIHNKYREPMVYDILNEKIVVRFPIETLKKGEFLLEQYTGLKDNSGKEIYENCELDGRYIVEYIVPSFVGRDIVSGDIIELYDNKFTITKEHSELSQNPKGGIN